MLDKNDRRYIIRRIITYISIAFIMVLLNLFCPLFKASALTTDNYNNNWQTGITIDGVKTYNYNTNANGASFANKKGQLIFTIYQAPVNTGAEFINQVIIGSGSNYRQVCNIGSTSFYNDNNTQRAISTVICNDVQFTSSGWTFIQLQRPNNQGQTYILFSQQASLVENTSEGSSAITSQLTDIYNRVNSGFTDMYNMQLPQFVSINGHLNDIYNILSTSTGNITQSINNNTQAINDVNDSINDSTPPSNNEISGNANDWNNNNADNGVINQLVLMPITLLNSFVNGINGSCSPYDFGELWGEHIIFPCIDLSKTLGSVWTIIDVILSGMFIFIFGKRCVKIFNDFTNLRSGQIDTLYGGDE